MDKPTPESLISEARTPVYRNTSDEVWEVNGVAPVERDELIEKLTTALEDVLAERDALSQKNASAERHTRDALTKIDSFSWHRHDEKFIDGVRESAIAALNAIGGSNPLEKVTRVTVIGDNGVAFEQYGVYSDGAQMFLQDSGRTLKLFPKRG